MILRREEWRELESGQDGMRPKAGALKVGVSESGSGRNLGLGGALIQRSDSCRVTAQLQLTLGLNALLASCMRALLLALPVTVKVTTGSLPGVFTSQISHEVERFSLGEEGRTKRRSKQNKKQCLQISLEKAFKQCYIIGPERWLGR